MALDSHLHTFPTDNFIYDLRHDPGAHPPPWTSYLRPLVVFTDRYLLHFPAVPTTIDEESLDIARVSPNAPAPAPSSAINPGVYLHFFLTVAVPV